MSLRIRIQLYGSRHNHVYRIVVAEAKNKRDGRHNEVLGNYIPRSSSKNLRLNLERLNYWIKKGAKPTDTVRYLIKVYSSNASNIKGNNQRTDKI